MSTLRSVAILVTACAATAVLAACTSNAPAAAPASSAPATVKAHPGASAATSPATAPSTAAPATAPAASAPVATASTPATTSSAAGCATATGSGLPDSSITVCPAAGPVGSVVHVTIKGCAPVGHGLPDVPAAGLFFLGPDSWLGTNGGGGANVSYSPRTGSGATATFTIPATYTGGNQDGPYPTLTVMPGTGYEFITDPAGQCHIPFTVTAS
jgi:hypothetical protein